MQILIQRYPSAYETEYNENGKVIRRIRVSAEDHKRRDEKQYLEQTKHELRLKLGGNLFGDIFTHMLQYYRNNEQINEQEMIQYL